MIDYLIGFYYIVKVVFEDFNYYERKEFLIVFILSIWIEEDINFIDFFFVNGMFFEYVMKNVVFV